MTSASGPYSLPAITCSLLHILSHEIFIEFPRAKNRFNQPKVSLVNIIIYLHIQKRKLDSKKWDRQMHA